MSQLLDNVESRITSIETFLHSHDASMQRHEIFEVRRVIVFQGARIHSVIFQIFFFSDSDPSPWIFKTRRLEVGDEASQSSSIHQ